MSLSFLRRGWKRQWALGGKEVEPKIALLNVTGRAGKANSYISILNDRLKKQCIILDLAVGD